MVTMLLFVALLVVSLLFLILSIWFTNHVYWLADHIITMIMINLVLYLISMRLKQLKLMTTPELKEKSKKKNPRKRK